MSRVHVALIPLLLLLLGGCAGKKATVDYDPDYAISKLRTYAVSKVQPDDMSPIDAERISNALDETLSEKGYVKSGSGSDFNASFRFRFYEDVPSNVSFGIGVGGVSGSTGVGVGASKQLRHDEAVLEIRMTDTVSQKTFWSASYRTKVNADAPPGKRDTRIKETVKSMLESFPKAKP